MNQTAATPSVRITPRSSSPSNFRPRPISSRISRPWAPGLGAGLPGTTGVSDRRGGGRSRDQADFVVFRVMLRP